MTVPFRPGVMPRCVPVTPPTWMASEARSQRLQRHASMASETPVADDEALAHLAELSRSLAAEDDLDGLLQRIVDLGVEEIDHCGGVSMMLIGSGGEISTPAFSSITARDSDLAQFATDEGPCLTAIRDHETVIIDDLRAEVRWPDYRQLALELGVGSMMSVRLFVAGDTIGALDFYSEKAHAFDRRAQLYGQVFGSHAAIALKAAITEAGLERALHSRDLIGQAKGILMERHGLTARDAFERLRCLSQEGNRAVREIAEELVRTGELTD
jgi:transcriptional regulator with GAF, ATPase, and Fis domain